MDQLSFDWLDNFNSSIGTNKNLVLIKLKKCSKCNKSFESTSDNFLYHKTSKDKLSGICKNCNSKRGREERRFRRDNNLCGKVSCSNKKLEHTKHCSYHQIYNIITLQKHVLNRFTHLNRFTRKAFVEELLVKLEKQNYVCPLTGEILILGINASLDHITPSSKGGNDNLDNLRWVTKRANLEKGVS